MKMRTRLKNLGMILSAFAMLTVSSRLAIANGVPQEAAKTGAYTIPEYNAFQAANAEKDPTAKLKDLDDFVARISELDIAAIRVPALLPDLFPAEELSEDD